MAYRYALSLAEHYGSKVIAQHVVELSRHPSFGFAAFGGLYDEFREALHQSAQRELAEFVKKHTQGGVQPQLVVDEGAAADSILLFAQAQKVDVVVMGTHGRRGFDRLVLGSVTDRVMRSTSCPVLAISKPPHQAATGPEGHHPHRLNRILFCTDFSQNSQRALNYAISATAEYDAELTLLHVLEEVPTAGQTQAAIATAAEELDKLITPHQPKTMRVETAVRIGKAYEQILLFATEARIDMIIMTVHGRGVVDEAVFGSTTYRVIQLGPCPVLAVPA
jgi:nucleotide-binding universal stress UspA family protein